MKIQRSLDYLHPVLIECVRKIQTEVIDQHNVPMKMFETSRDHSRHEMLINKGKTKDFVSRHLYNLRNDPPLYATAVDYVFYDGKWSWNLRDGSVSAWYQLFGNLVLDACPELEWGGFNRKATNYCHFQVRRDILVDKLGVIPCVIP